MDERTLGANAFLSAEEGVAANVLLDGRVGWMLDFEV